MSKWNLEFKEQAEDDLFNLDESIQDRVVNKINWLEENFDDITPLSLSRELKRFFKLRVGDWRIVYIVNDENKNIVIHMIDHRSKIYKRLS